MPSFVWEYFTKKSSTHARCKLKGCTKVYKWNKGLSGMATHLKIEHGITESAGNQPISDGTQAGTSSKTAGASLKRQRTLVGSYKGKPSRYDSDSTSAHGSDYSDEEISNKSWAEEIEANGHAETFHGDPLETATRIRQNSIKKMKMFNEEFYGARSENLRLDNEYKQLLSEKTERMIDLDTLLARRTKMDIDKLEIGQNSTKEEFCDVKLENARLDNEYKKLLIDKTRRMIDLDSMLTRKTELEIEKLEIEIHQLKERTK